MDSTLNSIVEKIPLCSIQAGPRFTNLYKIRDEKWVDRLKEEYMALIKYIEVNK